MPAIEPGDTVRLAAQDLIVAMQKLANAPIDLNPKHTQALWQLTEIFNEAARVSDNKENSPAPRVTNTSAPRVQTTSDTANPLGPSTSTDPTAPQLLEQPPHECTNAITLVTIHQCQPSTRNHAKPYNAHEDMTNQQTTQNHKQHDRVDPSHSTNANKNTLAMQPPQNYQMCQHTNQITSHKMKMNAT
jgi:hypothetical protein